MARNLSAILLAVCLSAPGAADTLNHTNPAPNQLWGPITADRALTAASPGAVYDVLGDVIVKPGVTLTIEPGVTLSFRANSDFLASGLDRERCEFVVDGRVEAAGGGCAGEILEFGRQLG